MSDQLSVLRKEPFIRPPNIYCSAGLDHFQIQQNGDVFACFAYVYSVRQAQGNLTTQPLSEIRHGFRPCPLGECAAVCDQISTTLYDNTNGQYDKAPLRPEEPSIDFDCISIFWSPTNLCNYRCSYCTIPQLLGNKKTELSQSQWIEIFTRIIDDFSPSHLATAGGEPLLSNSTIPVFEMIQKEWTGHITTNLTVRVQEIIDRLDPKKISIAASLHSIESKFDYARYKANANLLRDAGFNLYGVYVMYQPEMKKFPMFQADLQKEGIYLEPVICKGNNLDGTPFNVYGKADMKFLDQCIRPEPELVTIDLPTKTTPEGVEPST